MKNFFNSFFSKVKSFFKNILNRFLKVDFSKSLSTFFLDRSIETIVNELKENREEEKYFRSPINNFVLKKFYEFQKPVSDLPNFLNDKSISTKIWRYLFIFVYLFLPFLFGFVAYLVQPKVVYFANTTPPTDWLSILNQILIFLFFGFFLLIWTFCWTFRKDMKFTGLIFILNIFFVYFLSDFFHWHLLMILKELQKPLNFDNNKLIIIDVIGTIIIVFCFLKLRVFTITFFLEFKKNFLAILLTSLIGVGMIYFLNFIFYKAFPKYFLIYNSKNYLKFPMIYSLIIIGPILEELTYREGLYRLVKNRWIFFIFGSLLFAYIHVNERDMYFNEKTLKFILISQFPKIIKHLTGAFVLQGIYIYKKSVAYTIPTHFLNNLISIFA